MNSDSLEIKLKKLDSALKQYNYRKRNTNMSCCSSLDHITTKLIQDMSDIIVELTTIVGVVKGDENEV